jgi:PAS domain S-box-containing protein
MIRKAIREINMYDLMAIAIDQTEVGISIVDIQTPDQPLIFVNKGFIKMTGYTEEEVIGKNCRFLQGNEPNDAARRTIRQSVLEGKSCKVLLKNYRKDGSFFWNELHLTPIYNNDGTLTHYSGIQHDVTDREIAAENSRMRKELLSEYNEKLHQVNKDRNELLSTVAHDLRSPLANISGIVEILQHTTNKDEAKKYLKHATEILSRVHTLVDDYLSYDSIQAGQTPLQKKSVDLKKFVLRMTDILSMEAEKKEMTLKVSSNFSSDVAFFDPDRMEQVVTNLFHNALKFSHRGSLIEIDFESTPDTFILKVKDSGRGIKEEELSKIFQAFQRSSTQSTEGEPGFGLGLSIVTKIVELHEGKINVKSSYGKGSEFQVSFPCAVEV